MTIEENKAIEILKEQINFYDANNIKDTNSHKLMNLIEKLKKENEELKRNSISKKRVEKFLEVIQPQAMPKDIPDDLEIDEEELLSRMYNSGAVGALETILDRNNDAFLKGGHH